MQRQLPFDVDVLKIDVPAEATALTPWRLTRQSRQPYYEVLRPERPPFPRRRGDPEAGILARLDYRVSVRWGSLEPDSDIYAFARDRVVPVTPLSQDLTSRTDLDALERSLRGFETGGLGDTETRRRLP